MQDLSTPRNLNSNFVPNLTPRFSVSYSGRAWIFFVIPSRSCIWVSPLGSRWPISSNALKGLTLATFAVKKLSYVRSRLFRFFSEVQDYVPFVVSMFSRVQVTLLFLLRKAKQINEEKADLLSLLPSPKHVHLHVLALFIGCT